MSACTGKFVASEGDPRQQGDHGGVHPEGMCVCVGGWVDGWMSVCVCVGGGVMGVCVWSGCVGVGVGVWA